MSDNRETPFSEAQESFDREKLSPAMKRTFDAAQRAATAEFAPGHEETTLLTPDGIRAHYKIEIHFGPGRTTKKDYKALILLMESGRHFHGGGDGQMYLCLDHRPYETMGLASVLPALRAKRRKEAFQIPGCGMPIPSALIALGRALCPSCGSDIVAQNLMGQIPFCGSTQELVELVEILFHNLNDNADIYCKYDRQDIRYEACEKKFGFEKARALRGLFIYPLKNLIKDQIGGSSLSRRLQVFLSA